MKVYEIGTGYTPIPAKISAATELVVEELTRAMMRRGVEVEIIDIQTEDRLPHQLPITEVKVPKWFAGTDVQLGIMHKLKRVVYSICLANKLKKILKIADEKVVLHFHNQYNMFFFEKLVPMRYKKRALKAYTNHSGVWRLPWEENQQMLRRKYFQEEESMNKADLVFVLNRDSIENICAHTSATEEKMKRIAHGVNSEVFHPLNENEVESVRRKYGLEGKKVILQVGSIYENKGQARVLKMLTPLMQKNSELVYAFAGGIVSEDYFQQVIECGKQAGLADRVIYLGMIKPGEELNQVYNAADVTVVASQYEAFGLVYLESLAAGIPVLTEKGSDFEQEKGCISYTPETVCDVIEMNILNEEKKEQHQKQARENAVNNYSWDRIAQQYLQGFAAALGEKSAYE